MIPCFYGFDMSIWDFSVMKQDQIAQKKNYYAN